jgi:hypothetical protein
VARRPSLRPDRLTADAKAAKAAVAAVAAASALADGPVKSPGPPSRHPTLTEAFTRGYAMDYKRELVPGSFGLVASPVEATRLAQIFARQ